MGLVRSVVFHVVLLVGDEELILLSLWNQVVGVFALFLARAKHLVRLNQKIYQTKADKFGILKHQSVSHVGGYDAVILLVVLVGMADFCLDVVTIMLTLKLRNNINFSPIFQVQNLYLTIIVDKILYPDMLLFLI